MPPARTSSKINLGMGWQGGREKGGKGRGNGGKGREMGGKRKT